MKKSTVLLVTLLLSWSLVAAAGWWGGGGTPPVRPAAAAETVKSGEGLQARLDRGENLELEPRTVYLIKTTLRFKVPGQVISTRGAPRLADYAVLRLASRECIQLVNGNGIPRVTMERVVLDGNRYQLSGPLSENDRLQALAHFGGKGADAQTIRRCVFMDTRSWSSLKIHEGAADVLAESNIILGAGADAHGNGRELREIPFGWGDGISCAARNTRIRDNLVIDSTDAAIVLFGAPGSVVENNVVAAISRESLGAINMVDPLDFYAVDGDLNRTDYRGVMVRHNLIDVRGARIHIAVAMGGGPWAPRNKDSWLVGATVTGNTISGSAGGYGFVACGVENFTVADNVSTASYSGLGDGLNQKTPPDDPGPFLYTPASVINCTLQPEFTASKRHLLHLLRCNHGPLNAQGFRVYSYGAAEAEAIVRTAFLEMLGRAPKAKEFSHWLEWLQTTKGAADQIRRALIMTPEFTDRHGFVPPDDLHLYRRRMWLENLDQAQADHFSQTKTLPTARQLYEEAIKRLGR